jgi:predicted nuclease of predicted toxin-antitoxin system
MKLLFDQNISFRITKKLKSYFADCLHVSDCKLSDCEDQKIWEYAKENNCVIVTFDSDFYDISIINGHPPKIIWIRTGNVTTPEIAQLIIHNQKIINSFLNNDEFKDISCLELEQ